MDYPVFLEQQPITLESVLREIQNSRVVLESEWLIPPIVYVETPWVMAEEGVPNPRAGHMTDRQLQEINARLARFGVRVRDTNVLVESTIHLEIV